MELHEHNFSTAARIVDAFALMARLPVGSKDAEPRWFHMQPALHLGHRHAAIHLAQ